MDISTMDKTGMRRINPLIAGAAVSVMVLSLVGIGALTGILPTAWSQKAEAQRSGPGAAAEAQRPGPGTTTAQATRCESCGTIEAIRSVELRGEGSGLGAVAGGVTGAVLGNQLGAGRGNTAMTILGAAGGAFAGNEVEKSMKRRYSYRVTVRMDDGSFRTVPQPTPPAFAVGDRVRVVAGALVRPS